MLSLLINGQAVDLPDDFSITLNLKSPIFSEIGSYSYPFKIKNTPRNSKIIGFLHRQEGTTDPFVTVQSRLLWKGLSFEDTIVRYTQVDFSLIEGTLLQAEGSFFNAIKDKMLRTVNTGEYTFDGDFAAIDFINSLNGKFYPEVNLAFPEIWNPDYLDPVTEDPEQEYFNRYRTTTNTITIATPSGNRNIIVPYNYLRHVLVSIFKDAGYSLTDLIFSKHPDYNRLIVFNSLTNNSLIPDFNYTLTRIFSGMHLPNVKISEFLTGIESMFNCRFFVDNLMKNSRLISVDDILKSTDYIEFSQRFEKLTTELTSRKTGFHYSLGIDSDDAIFDQYTSIEDEFVGRIRPSVKKISDLPQFPLAEIGEIRFVEYDNEFYNLSPTKIWSPAPVLKLYIFSQFLFRDFSEKIDSKISSLGPIDEGIFEYDVVCKNTMANWKEVSPRVIFAKYGSLDDRPIMVGRNHTDNFGLFFNHNNNLFDVHYKRFFNWFLQARPAKGIKHMTFEEIKNLDFSRKHRINGLDYLIKSVRVTLAKDRIKPATLELYKV